LFTLFGCYKHGILHQRTQYQEYDVQWSQKHRMQAENEQRQSVGSTQWVGRHFHPHQLSCYKNPKEVTQNKIDAKET